MYDREAGKSLLLFYFTSVVTGRYKAIPLEILSLGVNAAKLYIIHANVPGATSCRRKILQGGIFSCVIWTGDSGIHFYKSDKEQTRQVCGSYDKCAY